MAIDPGFLETLKMSCDIESVISGYLHLRRQGRNLVGLCPFHSEKTPSMVVYNDTQSFYCFGCGAGGDVISFIMRIENLDYLEAVKFLCQRVGLQFPENGETSEASRIKPIILDINRQTARFYHQCLLSEEGEPGRAYFSQRQLSAKTITKYGLGYAPPGWSSLRDYLHKQGFSDDQLIAAAVAVRGRNGSCYDAFRNRVIFPIIDLKKNVIGFGGRVLDDSKPKYLNSSDTPVFKKSRNLFSLNFAKNTADKRLILAEGYMDVIAVNQAGFENVVATLGTALTSEQARLIKTYASEVIIAYDSDEAGRKATDRATALLDEAGVTAKVLNFKGAKDPDEYIKKFGVQRFKLLLDGANNVIDYQLSAIRAKYDIDLPDGKGAYLAEASKYLATVPSGIEREIYAGILAGQTAINKETILSNIDLLRRRRLSKSQKKEWTDIQQSRAVFGDRINPQRPMNLSAALAEEGILAFLFRNQDYLDKILQKLTPDDFVTDFNRELFCIMIEKLQNNNVVSFTDFTETLSSEQLGKFAGIVAQQSEVPITPQGVDDLIMALKDYQDKLALKHAGSLSNQELDEIARRIREKKKK